MVGTPTEPPRAPPSGAETGGSACGAEAHAVINAAPATRPYNGRFIIKSLITCTPLRKSLQAMIDSLGPHVYVPRFRENSSNVWAKAMKVKSSIKALKSRHRDCKVVRRRGRTYVINKTDPRFKAKQG